MFWSRNTQGEVRFRCTVTARNHWSWYFAQAQFGLFRPWASIISWKQNIEKSEQTPKDWFDENDAYYIFSDLSMFVGDVLLNAWWIPGITWILLFPIKLWEFARGIPSSCFQKFWKSWTWENISQLQTDQMVITVHGVHWRRDQHHCRQPEIDQPADVSRTACWEHNNMAQPMSEEAVPQNGDRNGEMQERNHFFRVISAFNFYK